MPKEHTMSIFIPSVQREHLITFPKQRPSLFSLGKNSLYVEIKMQLAMEKDINIDIDITLMA